MKLGVGLDIPTVATNGGIAGLAGLVGSIARYPPTVDIDFVANTSKVNGVTSTAALAITITRATAAWAPNAAGVYSQFLTGVARINDNGLLLEEARTNVVLQNRDLANASWTKTNCTAVKDQVGIDGVAASASSLTATADAATCTQAITLSSAARYQSVFVRRITGSGVVEMSMDGGSTWTAITPTLTTWVRKTMATQTLANPGVQFRMATNGDAIGIDFVQNENGIYATSPIDVTTVAKARNADASAVANFATWFNQTTSTIYQLVAVDSPLAGTAITYAFSNGSNTDRMYCAPQANGKSRTIVSSGNVSQANLDSTLAATIGVLFKSATALALNDLVNTINNGTITTDTAVTLPVSMTQLNFGSTIGAAAIGIVRISRLVYWGSRLPNTEVKGMTA